MGLDRGNDLDGTVNKRFTCTGETGEFASENMGYGLNEISFHLLFERFVRNFYRFNLKDHEVKREALDWHDELGCSFVPSMQTDITIVEK